MNTAAKTPRPGGRTERNRVAVHRAVIAALQEQGPNFSYTDLADRSGVSRRTIHRRWPDRDALLFDVLQEEYGSFSFTPTGDLAQDLREFGLKFRDFSAKPTTILVDGLSALSPDTELSSISARAFTEYTRPLRRTLVSTRTERGLKGTKDLQVLLMMLIAPITASSSILRSPMTDEAVERLAHLVHQAALAEDAPVSR